jgi:hypothetical protein
MGRAWRTGVALAVLALAAGCAGSKAEQKPDKVTERTVTGNLEFVDSRSVMVSSPDHPDAPAQLLSRGADAKVQRDGHDVKWSELNEGEQVRVTYTERMSGPSEVARVEILSGDAKGGKDTKDGAVAPPPMEPDTQEPPFPGEPGSDTGRESNPLPPTTPTPAPPPGGAH